MYTKYTAVSLFIDDCTNERMSLCFELIVEMK